MFTLWPYSLFSIHAFASRFPTELNVGEVSAQVFWNLFSADLQDMLKGIYNSSFCYFFVNNNTHCFQIPNETPFALRALEPQNIVTSDYRPRRKIRCFVTSYS